MDLARYCEYARRHHERYTRHVEAHGLVCQACRGRGGRVEPVLDYGAGPWEDCYFCEGTGKVTRRMRGMWLTWKRTGAL